MLTGGAQRAGRLTPRGASLPLMAGGTHHAHRDFGAG